VEPEAQIKSALKSVFGQQTIPTVDYAQPPARCLEAREDGTLTLVTDTHDLLIEVQLAHCAEPTGEKQYRLTRESLQRMRQAGVNAKSFLAFLELRLLRGAIPPLLEVAIRSGLGEKTTVQADMAYVLHIKDKKLYAALTTSPLLKPYLLDNPGPDTIVISQAKLDAFKEQLDWLGITLAPYAPQIARPDWQQTVRDAKTQQKRRRDWW
jgi:hypothetical protein